MTQHTWTYDAPSGVYKNHQLSSQLRWKAIAETKFMSFVKPEPGYGRKQGESITIKRISTVAEPTNPRLSEGQRIPEDAISFSTVAITVAEWGRSVPFTSLSEDLGELNVENIVQQRLRDQMKLCLDTGAATSFKTAKVKAVGTGAASMTFSTNGTPATSALVNLNMYHVEQIRDYMYNTLLVPPYEGDDYICIFATKAKRGLISDPAWETWHKYTDPQAKYNAEIGRIENIRFIECNHSNALSNAIGTSSVTGEAVFFGQDAVAMATVIDPELRVEINKGQDFGRMHACAWYGILEFGLIWDTGNAGEARVVHWSST